jgi:hypothetical protein
MRRGLEARVYCMSDRSILLSSSMRALKTLGIAERRASLLVLDSGKELGGLLAVARVS